MESAQSSSLQLNDRITALVREFEFRLHTSTDLIFKTLMIFQWLGGVLIAILLTPTSWAGSTSQIHIHVWGAVLIGGTISLGSIAISACLPGSPLTRHAFAISQMLWSALLIHLTGGRIETHFHVFGSLAFIAFYRDWRALLTATLVTAGDHVIRGYWWPQSVYGILMVSPFRWIEHAAWVVFEDLFLLLTILRSTRDAISICTRRAELEITNAEIEMRVTERTAELHSSQKMLEGEFAKHKETQKERERLFSELASASRQAGMAEIATGVLHNVGNVLNSVNVSAQIVADHSRQPRADRLRQLALLIVDQKQEVGQFFDKDPRARKIPDFLTMVADSLERDQKLAHTELMSLMSNVDHIKQIITSQQSIAKGAHLNEPVNLQQIVKESIKINDIGLQRHGIEIDEALETVAEIVTDKHKVMQIIVNLIKNAKQAVQANNGDRRISVTLREANDNGVEVTVSDNGIGIAADHLSRIFTHGFTTKADGHGFGLHSAVLSAKQLGGTLIVASDGLSKGASFTLTIPRGRDTKKPTLAHDSRGQRETDSTPETSHLLAPI